MRGWKLDKPVGWFMPLPGGVGKRRERRKQAEYKRPLRGNDATCDRIPEGFTLPENKPTCCIFIHVQVNFPLLIVCVFCYSSP